MAEKRIHNHEKQEEKYKQALREIPAECNLDPLTQTTIEDLVFIAQTELDIIQEEPECYLEYMSKKELTTLKNKLKKYIKKYS